MRMIALDTETTGLDPYLPDEESTDPKTMKKNHRIIEIACVELINGTRTGKVFHEYFNPGRLIDDGAKNVHGISEEFLADKPVISKKIDEFLSFVEGSQLIIHNAPFDIKFLNAELGWLGKSKLETVVSDTIDTLAWAREVYPGQRNTLDGVCDRLQIDRSHRTVHGALVDTEILADVYVQLAEVIKRRRASLNFKPEPEIAESAILLARSPRVLTMDPMDAEIHRKVVESLNKASGGKSAWPTEQAPGI